MTQQTQHAAQLDILCDRLALQHAARFEDRANACVGRLRPHVDRLHHLHAHADRVDLAPQRPQLFFDRCLRAPILSGVVGLLRAFGDRLVQPRPRARQLLRDPRVLLRPRRQLVDRQSALFDRTVTLASQPRHRVRAFRDPPREIFDRGRSTRCRLLARQRCTLHTQQLLLDSPKPSPMRRQLRSRRTELRLQLRRFGQRRALALRRLVASQRRQFSRQLLKSLRQHLAALAIQRHAPFEVAHIVLHRPQPRFARADFALALVDRRAQLRQPVLARVRFGFHLLERLAALILRCDRGQQQGVDLLPLVRVPDVQRAGEFARQLLILHRAPRLALQLVDPRLDLANQHPHTIRVLARLLQLALRVLKLVAEQAHVRRFFDERASILGSQAQYLLDHALAHERVTVLPDLRLHEQLEDIPKPNLRVVDQVLVLATAIRPARHDHFVKRNRQPMQAVVQRDAHFGHALRRSLVAAGEDHVFGLPCA